MRPVVNAKMICKLVVGKPNYRNWLDNHAGHQRGTAHKEGHVEDDEEEREEGSLNGGADEALDDVVGR